jgi:hypothetical protein
MTIVKCSSSASSREMPSGVGMEIQDTSIIVMSFLGSTTECRKILTHSGITDSSKDGSKQAYI